jgi:hypothetical protein
MLVATLHRLRHEHERHLLFDPSVPVLGKGQGSHYDVCLVNTNAAGRF